MSGDSSQCGPGDILPVLRSKRRARRYYDRLSGIYDYLTAAFERKLAERSLAQLEPREGESVLEVGFGSGHCLKRIALLVGSSGQAHGIDLSPGMIRVAERKVARANLSHRVHLLRGDASSLPFADGVFDAALMTYTLELFDTPEIPAVLRQLKAVLKPGGRLAVAAMSKAAGTTAVLRLYEWGHTRWPTLLDCRPIYLHRSLEDAGFEVRTCEEVRSYGLPTEIAVAIKPAK
jgi:ubiquinone/menaquinone biosynthesis C-methylase UbiE